MHSQDTRQLWRALKRAHEQIRLNFLLLPVREEDPVASTLRLVSESALLDVPLFMPAVTAERDPDESQNRRHRTNTQC